MTGPRPPPRPPQTSSPHAPYDPRQYSPQPSQPPPTSFAPPNRTHSNSGPQPYNPAAYQENSIATAANQIYGPATAAFPSTNTPYPSQTPTSFSPSVQFPHYGAPPAAQYHSFVTPVSPSGMTSPRTGPPPSLPPRALPSSPSVQSPYDPWQSSSRPPHRQSLSTGNQVVPSILQSRVSPDFQRRDDLSSSVYGAPNTSTYDASGLHLDSFPRPPGSEQSGMMEGLGIGARHPQSRPLPGAPPSADAASSVRSHGTGSDDLANHLSQQDLFDEVENAVMGRTSSYSNHQSRQNQRLPRERPEYDVSHASINYNEAPSSQGRRVNGYQNQSSTPLRTHFYDEDDEGHDSDAEAVAGLQAMRMAEEQESNEGRRRSDNSGVTNDMGLNRQDTTVAARHTDDYDDFHNVDMSMYDGGFSPSMSYGGDPTTLAANHSSFDSHHRSTSSRGSLPLDTDGYPMRTSSSTSMNTMSTRPTTTSARVDESGTGGFSDPNDAGRKMSFDQDDDRKYYDMAAYGGAVENRLTPEMYADHSNTTGRPLPSPPEPQYGQYPSMEEAQQQQYFAQLNSANNPIDPGYYDQQLSQHQGPHVPRSQSVGNHSNTQQTVPPIRSKTDAEDRKRMTMIRASMYGQQGGFENLPSEAATELGLDLPTIPSTRRFQPAKLTQREFDRCEEPWALSCVIPWLRKMADGESELKEYSIVEALVNLFTYKVPNLNIAEAETLASRVVDAMFRAGTLIHEEEWLRFGPDITSGVLFQLTGQGCYSHRLHDHEEPSGRCYSHYCQRTVRKVNVDSYDPRQADDWASFHKMNKGDLEGVERKEVERQNNLHEIVQSEFKYIEDLKRLRFLYKDGLESAEPSIIPPKSLKNFINQVFGKLDAVQKANENYLLPQLKYRQQDQGPWIVGFSDIFRDWIRKAKAAYIEYSANFPNADFLIRQETRRNVLFGAFLEGARNNKLSDKLPWDNFLKAPITKLQRYSLLLSSVHNNMRQESEEKLNLLTAINEIRSVTKECDARYAEMSRKVKLLDLQSRLILRPEMKKVDLNLTQWGRELFFTSDLQRTGQNRFTWLDTHGILLDNYLVLAKAVSHRESKSDHYDVSKMPIPMDLLLLESNDDDPVVKSSMKGIAAVSTVTSKATLPQDAKMIRATSNQSPKPGVLNHTNSSSGANLTTVNTGGSEKNLVTSTILNSDSKDEKILYPFRIRHLGKEVFTLFASSAQNRREWCDKIIEAKTKHAAALFAQNAEPFRLRVIADSAFAYEGPPQGNRSVTIKGSPLHRALEDVDKTYANVGRPAPICRARVHCATSFNRPDGRKMMAAGTDYGVYFSEAENPRGWTRAITAVRVSQMAVLEEFGLFLLVSDKSLIAYHLDVVCPVNGTTAPADSMKKAPQKLSGNRDIGFFAAGRMKDRTLVFYEKREGRSSIFKILEPIYQKNSTHALTKSRHFLSSFKGSTEFFRDYDDFYIPADCTSIDLFNTSLAIATSKGFEVLTLDKKTPWSVPDLRQAHVSTIAARLNGMEPVSMFRLAADGSELLCVYEECAVYVNKYGDISRSVVLEFVGKVKQASLVGGYLVLFDSEFVEVRDALNGRLKQVIAGRDVRCLDSGRGQAGVTPPSGYGQPSSGVERTIKFALQHPEQERTQLLVEMVLNEDKRQ